MVDLSVVEEKMKKFECSICGNIFIISFIYYGLNNEEICKDCYEKLSEKEKSNYNNFIDHEGLKHFSDVVGKSIREYLKNHPLK